MREIKFRAKRTDNNPVFWAVGYLVKTPITTEFNCDGQYLDSGGVGRYCIVTDNGVAHEIDIKTAGQFTGLKDKNGKEIYEGDILKLGRPYANEIVVLRNYIEDTYWITENRGIFKRKPKIEILGNIYENPSLISKEK